VVGAESGRRRKWPATKVAATKSRGRNSQYLLEIKI